MANSSSPDTKEPSSTPAASPILLAPWQKGLSGSFGGLAEACLLQPIDTIKTRLQLDHSGQYRGIIDAGRQISRTEGVPALWKGVTPFATQLFLKYSLRFSSQAFFAGLLRDEHGRLSDGRRMLSGLCAGVSEALIIITPLETAKIRLQQQRGLDKAALKYHGPVHAATTILREEGVRGLWSGATPTMLRNGTNQMCLFYFKNKADALYWGKTEGDGTKLTPSQSMVSGFSAACVGPLATGPMDVIKTRLQSQNRSAVGGAKYAGFLHALVTIPREEGVRALWKGMLPRLVRIPCGQAIVWAVSDQITGAFEARARAALTAK